MVKLTQMRDLMRYHIIQHRIRRHHQAPGKGERAIRRARPPAALRILHANGLDGDTKLISMDRGQGNDAPLCLTAQKIAQASGQEFRRTSHDDGAIFHKSAATP